MSSSGAADNRIHERSSPVARTDSPPIAPSGNEPAPLGTPAPSPIAEWKLLSEFDIADIQRWRELAARALEPNVFLEPSFALAAAKYLPGADDVGALLIRDGARLTGLLPGRVEGLAAGRPVPTFVGWTHAYAPLSTPLLDRDVPKEAIGCVLYALPLIPGRPQLLLYPSVNEGGAVAQLRASELARKGIPLSRFGSHQRAMLRCAASNDPLASISGGRLKELRRQRRRLGELGTLVQRSLTQGKELADAIEAYLSLEARGWKGKAGSAAQSNAATRAFLQEAVTALAAEHKARIDLLELGSTPVAAAITLFSGDRAWFWKIAYDEDYARFSPGVQLALDLTEELGRDSRISLVDSCAVAGHPMIDHLWRERLSIADWMMPLARCSDAARATAVAAEKARRLVIGGLRGVRRIVRT